MDDGSTHGVVQEAANSHPVYIPSTARVPILDSRKSNNVLGADGLAFPSSSSSSGRIRPLPFPFPRDKSYNLFSYSQMNLA